MPDHSTSEIPDALADVRSRARVRRWMHAEAVRIVRQIQNRRGTHESVIAGEAMKSLIDVCCRVDTPNLVSEAGAESLIDEELRRHP